MLEPPNTPSILCLRVHSHTGGAALEGLPWAAAALPEAAGDFRLSIPLTDRALTADVLRRLMQAPLEIVTVHLRPAPCSPAAPNRAPELHHPLGLSPR